MRYSQDPSHFGFRQDKSRAKKEHMLNYMIKGFRQNEGTKIHDIIKIVYATNPRMENLDHYYESCSMDYYSYKKKKR